MMQRDLLRSLGLVILLAWACASSPAVVRAQNTPFSSPALDSNCYFPQIGVPGEIDTIYGAVYGQGVGGGLIKNLGPRPDGTPGNIIVGDLDRVNHDTFGTYTYYQAKTGPGFNLHNLGGKRMNLTDQQIGSNPVFAHLRTSKTLDLFGGAQIFWADDTGGYDSGRVTTLGTYVQGIANEERPLIPAYIARLTSDTVDDIVLTGYIPFADVSRDTVFCLLYRGGAALAAKDTAYEDTSAVVAPLRIGPISDYAMQGDYRGVGREDLMVIQDTSDVSWWSICYFRNEPPFPLDRFAQAIKHDTIMTSWQWPKGFESGPAFSMRVLPKQAGDSSVDFLMLTGGRSNHSSTDSIAVFRGGPDFGSHRITIDSAAFEIRHPHYLDPSFSLTYYWPNFGPSSFMDAGDMTGTGNHVLYIGAGGAAHSFYDHFYLTGKALDEKTDMYVAGGGGVADTLTADGDKYGDVLFSFPGYTSDSDLVNYGKRYAGTLRLYHGSMNIPVHLNPRWAGVRSAASIACGSLTLSPNPAGARTVADILWPDDGLVHLSIYDVMGRSMRTEEYRLQGGETQLSIPLSELPAGVYFVGLEGSSCSATARVVKIGDRTSGPANSYFQNIRNAVHGGALAMPQASPLPR